jgi:hypothetical protein
MASDLHLNKRSALTLDRASFSQSIPNTSSGFDYYELNKARHNTARQVGTEQQTGPAAIDHQPQDPFVVIGQPGSGPALLQCLPSRISDRRAS